MKKLILFLGAAIFAVFFSAVGFGQAGSGQAPVGGKIGLINPAMFADEKAGIAKYYTGLANVDRTVEPLNVELKALSVKYQTAKTDYQNLQKAATPVKPEALQAKANEIRDLETTIKRKQEDGKAKYDKIYSDTMSPIINDIIKALNDFAKQKGYAVILDGAKLEQADILWGFDERYDVTKEFIAFYNSRPPAAAATAAPK